MAPPVHLTLDGRPVTVPASTTVWEAARRLGLDIPVLCHDPRYRPVGGRMERVALPRNIILINDTYNANPQSMQVALESLAKLKGRSRGIAVLGDMGELGDSALEAHRATGKLVASLGLDHVFALGRFAQPLADAAVRAGMASERVHVGDSHEGIATALRELLQGNDWVLVKGSRSMKMERIVDALAADRENR